VPFVTFLLFGVFYAVYAPVVASLPAEVLSPGNRGPGFGIYYIWYFAGSAFLRVVAGYLTDVTGTAASSVLFGAAMMLATLLLVGLFRVAQAYYPAPAEPGDMAAGGCLDARAEQEECP
jgi:MFS family permease